MTLVQVVPTFDPRQEGVSAYAFELGRVLSRLGAVETRFLCRGIAPGAAVAEDSVEAFGENYQSLERVISDPSANVGAVLLHYVGYGFQQRGAPVSLVRSIERIRKIREDLALGIFFHEVHAFGPPWRSSFWLMPAQRGLARRLLSLSDVAATSLDRYRRRLAPEPLGKEVEVLAIPSTVGEPSELFAWEGRSNRLVVFGSEGVRRRAWVDERAALASTVNELGIEEVVDIGPGVVAVSNLGGARIERRGLLKAVDLSRELASARAGFVAYPPDYLDKSTVFAAYLAHGLAPVVAWSGPRGRSPRAGEAWIRAGGGDLESGGMRAVAERALAAYQSRSMSRHVEFWSRSLLGK